MHDASAEEQAKQAKITCLRLLAASPKSAEKLRKKLADRGYSADIIRQTLADLRAQGVLDDGVYAKDLMARLTLGQGAGRHRIAFELKRRGIAKTVRNELLGRLSEEDELERAREQARQKWGAWSKLEPQKRKKRLYDFLIRKGYDYQIAQDVLRELLKDIPGDGI